MEYLPTLFRKFKSNVGKYAIISRILVWTRTCFRTARNGKMRKRVSLPCSPPRRGVKFCFTNFSGFITKTPKLVALDPQKSWTLEAFKLSKYGSYNYIVKSNYKRRWWVSPWKLVFWISSVGPGMSFRINVGMAIISNLDNGSTSHQRWLRQHMSCSPAQQNIFFCSGGIPLKIYIDIFFAIFESRDTYSFRPIIVSIYYLFVKFQDYFLTKKLSESDHPKSRRFGKSRRFLPEEV